MAARSLNRKSKGPSAQNGEVTRLRVKKPIHVVSGLFLRPFQDVGVAAQRGAHIGVAEHLADHLHRHPVGRQDRRGAP